MAKLKEGETAAVSPLSLCMARRYTDLMTTQVSIRMDSDLYAKVQQAVQAEGTTVTAIIHRALRRDLDENRTTFLKHAEDFKSNWDYVRERFTR